MDFDQNQEVNGEVKQEEISVGQADEQELEEPMEEVSEPVLSYEQYRANIKNMKADMRAMKKEAKQQQRQERQQNAGSSAKRGVGGVGLVAMLLGAVAVGCALSLLLVAFVPNMDNSLLAQMAKKYGSQQTTIIQNNGAGGDITITDETTSAAKAVYQKAAQSVVGIRVVGITNQFFNKTETVLSEGSGVIYSEDGLVITNYHVIGDAIGSNMTTDYEIRVYLDTALMQYYEAEVIGTDEDTDLALLKINVTGLTPIEFADHNTIEIGDTAFAIGSPGGLDYMNSISTGIVSGLNRDLTTDTGVSFELIQTTAAINPGNSGGALLNSEGKLIGICVIKIAATEYEGMGFAINTNTIQDVISSIQTNGTIERPTLGVTVRTDYNTDMAQSYGYPAGAYVYEVEAGSCAEKGGLQPHDIIYQFGDVAINGYTDLKKALNTYDIGDTVVLKVYRLETEEHVEVTVTLEK